MRLEIQPEDIVGVLQADSILVGILHQQRHDTLGIITAISMHVAIRIGRLHGVDGCHESRLLVERIPILHDILQGYTQLGIARHLQPIDDTAAVEIIAGNGLVVEQHGYQVVDIVGHEVSFRVDHKRLVFQPRRREVDIRGFSQEPFLYLFIRPSF